MPGLTIRPSGRASAWAAESMAARPRWGWSSIGLVTIGAHERCRKAQDAAARRLTSVVVRAEEDSRACIPRMPSATEVTGE